MNDNIVKIFSNNEFGRIRVLEINNEPYFVGKDVANKLGYKDTSDALKRHVSNNDKLTRDFTDSGQSRKMIVINESGLYTLIFGSKLPQAEEFKFWVTKEVLPSIRKHGVYAKDELLNNPDLLIQVATQLKEEREKAQLLEQQLKEQKPLITLSENLLQSERNISVGDMAKILFKLQNKVGRNRLFEFLRNKQILMSDNVPYQKYMERGYFDVKEVSVNKGKYFEYVPVTYITPKGQLFVSNLVKEKYQNKGELINE